MRTKYPHAFSLDRCQFPSGSVATPSGHAHFAAVVLQGYACSNSRYTGCRTCRAGSFVSPACVWRSVHFTISASQRYPVIHHQRSHTWTRFSIDFYPVFFTERHGIISSFSLFFSFFRFFLLCFQIVLSSRNSLFYVVIGIE